MELQFLLGLGLLFRSVAMEDLKADVQRNTESLKLLTKRLDKMTIDFYSFESRLEIKMQSMFDEWKSAITSKLAPPEDVTHELELTQSMKTVIEESVKKQSAIVYRAFENEKRQIRKLKSDIQADITHFKAKTDAVVESLNSSVQLELTEIVDKNAQSISSMSSNISTNTNEIYSLLSKISTNTNSITSISSRLSTSAKDISELSSKISSNTNSITSMSSRLSSSAKDISELSSNLSLNTNSLLTQSSRISELYAKRYFSAFHAWLSEDKDYSRDQTVVIDRVFTNYGNDYDPSTSVFTAPVNGTYIVLFNIRCRKGKSGNVWLSINREWLTGSARCEDGGQSASGGVWHLNKGDRVSIETGHGGVSIDSYYTTFSGALLYVD